MPERLKPASVESAYHLPFTACPDRHSESPHVFLLGATSIVGYNVALRGRPGVQCIVTSRSRHRAVSGWPRLALHDVAEIQSFCLTLPSKSIIIYCDAVCDVSKCEENPAWAREINIGNLQRVLRCLPVNARLVYVSSDHVFGDDGSFDEISTPCPVSRYGVMRVEAEQLALTRPGALVIRAGLPIGDSMDGKSGHRDWLRYRLTRGLPVTIVEDESRTAMPLPHLADRILDLAASGIGGIRHITAPRLISRPALANALKDHYQLPGELIYARRADQPAPHLGRIHIATRHSDPLAQPLPCPLDLLRAEKNDVMAHQNR